MSKILQIPSKIIESILKKRNEGFDNGTIPVYKSNKLVISIGNLTFGGSGKTPLAITLASELIQRGIKPGIIGRGYKRTMLDTNIVCDGKNIVGDWRVAGDEMFLIAQKLSIPAVVHKKKHQAAKIIEQFNIEVTILDDGFQHRYLVRDIDLVIIDEKTIEKPFVSPGGALREPPESLKRADFILAQENLDIPDTFMQYIKRQPLRFNISADRIYNLSTNETQNIAKRHMIAFCGIANPVRFKNSLQKEGIEIVLFRSFGDHHDYQQNDLKSLLKEARKLQINTFITTEKDAVKLVNYSQYLKSNNMELLVLPIVLTISDGKELLFDMIDKKLKELEG